MNFFLFAAATVANLGEAVVAPSAPSLGAGLLSALLSPGGIAAALAVLGSILGAILGPSEVRRRRVALGAYYAFHIVEDIDGEAQSTTLDKVAEGLKQVDAYFVANGWRPLKPGEQAVAKLQFTALNGQAVAAAKATAAGVGLAIAKAQDGAAAVP